MLIHGYDWNAEYTAQAAAQLAQQAAPQLTWSQQSRQNRHQSNSIAGGLFLMAAGGLHVACGLWEPLMERAPQLTLLPVLVVMALHVAAMAGACLGALLVHRWQTRSIYFLCGFLHCCGNALFIGLHTSMWAILGGRLLIGLAHGACYVCLIQHAGDNTAKEIRARLCSSIGATLTLSTFVYLALTILNGQLWRHTDVFAGTGLRPDVIYVWLGALALLLTVIGVVLVAWLAIESVLALMLRVPADGDAAAIEALQRLRGQQVLTHSLHAELMELKQMTTEDSRLSAIIFRNGNIRPLMLLCGLRLLHVLGNNALLNSTQIPGTQMAHRISEDNDLAPAMPAFGANMQWLAFVPLMLVGVRLLSATVSTLLADRLRRRFVVIQAFGAGSVVLLVAILATTLVEGQPMRYVLMFVVLLAKIQAFLGWSTDTVAHVVAAEAFGVRKKAWSVAAAVALENGAQLTLMLVYFTMSYGKWTVTGMLYVFGVKLMVLAGVLFWHMPETCGLGLAQCRNKMRGVAAPGAAPVYSRAYLGDLQRQQAYKISVY